MSERPNHFVQPCAPRDDDRAESIVRKTYRQLPLLPRQVDGLWVAPLKRSGRCELRLIERLATTPAEAVLRIERPSLLLSAPPSGRENRYVMSDQARTSLIGSWARRRSPSRPRSATQDRALWLGRTPERTTSCGELRPLSKGHHKRAAGKGEAAARRPSWLRRSGGPPARVAPL